MTQNTNTKKKVTINIEPDVYDKLKIISKINPDMTPAKVIELTVNDEPFKQSMDTLATVVKNLQKAEKLVEELKNDTSK